MIEHVTLRCRDVRASRDFYLKALAPLGYRIKYTYGEAFGFFDGKHTDFWVTEGSTSKPSAHVAFNCRTRKMVDRFYQAAMEAGALDNGPPGMRKGYGYAAFVFDPDGNNIEAISFARAPAKRQTGKAK